MSRNPDRDRRAKGVAVAVAVLTAAGGGLVAYGFSQQETRMPPPAAVSEGGHAGHGGASSEPKKSGSTSSASGNPHAGHRGMGGDASSSGAPSGSAAAYEQPSGETMPRSQPTSVRIPSLDVKSSVIDLGTQSNERMEVPQNGTDTGWFTGSPTPGELGPSILAAHVTWDKAPAVFFELGAMRKGQKVEVERKDGTTATFEVTNVGQYPKADFPTEQVYGEVDHAGLRLITCGGRFDGETGSHVDNIVVYGKLVGTS